MRKKITLILLALFVLCFGLQNTYLHNITKGLTLFLMPTGRNYYTGPAIVLCLLLDLVIDFISLDFEAIKLGLRILFRGALIFLVAAHIILVIGAIYFILKGGF